MEKRGRLDDATSPDATTLDDVVARSLDAATSLDDAAAMSLDGATSPAGATSSEGATPPDGAWSTEPVPPLGIVELTRCVAAQVETPNVLIAPNALLAIVPRLPSSTQGLTLVHLSAHRKRFWWDKGYLGCV